MGPSTVPSNWSSNTSRAGVARGEPVGAHELAAQDGPAHFQDLRLPGKVQQRLGHRRRIAIAKANGDGPVQAVGGHFDAALLERESKERVLDDVKAAVLFSQSLAEVRDVRHVQTSIVRQDHDGTAGHLVHIVGHHRFFLFPANCQSCSPPSSIPLGCASRDEQKSLCAADAKASDPVSRGRISSSCLGRPCSLSAEAHLLSRALLNCQRAICSGYTVFMAVAAAGSMRMPGPMVLHTVTLRMYVPFNTAGRALTMASITAAMFSVRSSGEKLVLPMGT